MWSTERQLNGLILPQSANYCANRLVLLLMCVAGLSSFNIDTKYPVIFQGASTDLSSRGTSSSKADTSFGQAVALSVSSDGVATLLVGAPHANSTLQLPEYADIRQSGVLYKCSIHSGGSCMEVLVDPTGNTFAPDYSYKDLKTGGCLGASVDVQLDGRGRAVVCAPRLINQKYSNHFLANGACYLTRGEIGDGKFHKLTLLSEGTRQFVSHVGIHTYLYSYGQTGFSVHFPDNGNELLMGAPDIFDWTGGLMRLSIHEKNSSSSFLPVNNETLDVFLPSLYVKGSARYDYFGYAVSSGIFYADGNTSYLVGAPNGDSGYGKVFLMRFPENPDASYTIHAERSGTAFAEYFGSSVLAIDLTGDGLCEIVVGAPFYSPRLDGNSESKKASFDVGRVFVFENYGDGTFQQKGHILYGIGSEGGRFGSTIARLYDLDFDGFEDMAVGEPYGDEGRGLVYIFHGGKSVTALRHSQVIYARNILTSLRGFGASISRGTDIDNNNYPDFAIGAPLSGDSILLRSRPIIEFSSHLSSIPERITVSDKELTLRACVSYDGKFVPDQLKVNISVELPLRHSDSFLIVGDTFTRKVQAASTIKRNISHCNNFRVQIAHKGLIDYSKPVLIRMEYHSETEQDAIEDNKITYIPTRTGKRAVVKPSRRFRRQTTRNNEPLFSDGFCSTCPITNPHSLDQKETILEIPFSVGCGDDSQCQSDLKITTSFPKLLADGFIIGSSKTVTMFIAIKNTREPALLTSLSLSIPSGVSLVRVPNHCIESSERSHLTCSVIPHLFTNTSQYNQTLEFDVTKLSVEPSTISRKKLLFNVTVSSASVELTPGDNSVNASLPLLWRATAFINGRPLQESVLFDHEKLTNSTSINSTDGSKYIQHTYMVFKSQESPLFSVITKFLVPVALVTDTGSLISITDLYQPDAFINSQRFQCKSDTIPFLIRENLGESIVRSFNISDLETFISEQSEESNVPIDSPSRIVSPRLSKNVTLTLDCNRSTRVRCAYIECGSVALLTNTDRISVTLSFLLNLSKLNHYREKIDHIEVVTHGRVFIANELTSSDDKLEEPSLEAFVITEVIADESKPPQLSVWILIGAVLGGLLLLALFTYGLHLGGFFERKYRDELQQLKASDYSEGVSS